MRAWFQKHWRWALLNVFALTVMVTLLLQSRTSQYRDPLLDPVFEQCGRWAIRFLLISLAMTPLNSLVGWRNAIPLRKPAGLWAFAFGLLHFLLYASRSLDEVKITGWWVFLTQDIINILGLSGLSILSLLALTSNRWSMQGLGKNWKRLHRLVYIAGCLVIVHGTIAAENGKKAMMRDAWLTHEPKIYLAILAVLLAVRIPVIRNGLRSILPRKPRSIPAGARPS
jgi:sulfoxide reductase heme-binding subunit YedZ